MGKRRDLRLEKRPSDWRIRKIRSSNRTSRKCGEFSGEFFLSSNWNFRTGWKKGVVVGRMRHIAKYQMPNPVWDSVRILRKISIREIRF